jgi:hypothetical protein
MSTVTPHGRKPLSADALFHVVRSGFADIPAPRCADVDMALTETRMSAFARFALKAPSLLAFDKERAEGNVHTISGIPRVPCDPSMRERLAPRSPTGLRPVLQSVLRQLQRGKALEARVLLEGHSLLALDGTGYFSSSTMHGASGWHTGPRHGAVTSAQQMVGAASIHPDVRAVVPLRPAPIGQDDGMDTKDWERHAAQRWGVQRRQDPPPLPFLVTEASLRAHAPPIETRHHHDRHSILGVKEGAHPFLFQQRQAAEHAGRVTP